MKTYNTDPQHIPSLGGHGITGTLYGTTRFYNPNFEGKDRSPSTYSCEAYRYTATQHPSTQRSNGLVEGGPGAGAGILIGGVDFKVAHPDYSYRAEFDGHTIELRNSLTGWRRQFDNCPLSAGKPFTVALAEAVWILSGKYLNYKRLEHLAQPAK